MTLWKTLHDYVILWAVILCDIIVPYYTECNLSLLVLIFLAQNLFHLFNSIMATDLM